MCETSRHRTRIATRRNRRERDERYGVTSEHRTLPTENSWAQSFCRMTLKQSHTIRVWYVYDHLPYHGWYENHEQTGRLSDDSVERRQRRQTTIQDSAVNVFMLTLIVLINGSTRGFARKTEGSEYFFLVKICVYERSWLLADFFAVLVNAYDALFIYEGWLGACRDALAQLTSRRQNHSCGLTW